MQPEPDAGTGAGQALERGGGGDADHVLPWIGVERVRAGHLGDFDPRLVADLGLDEVAGTLEGQPQHVESGTEIGSGGRGENAYAIGHPVIIDDWRASSRLGRVGRRRVYSPASAGRFGALLPCGTLTHMIVRTNAVIVGAAVVACSTTIAAGMEPTAPSPQARGTELVDQFQRQLQNTRTRLNLTDAQVEQVGPILQAAFEARLEVLREYGIDLRADSGSTGRLGFFQARRLRRDLDGVQERTMDELDDVLTDAQLEEYEGLQEERREAMRERLRQRR